jgi:DNA mismatch endonuclease, patch repair protein
MRNFQREVSAPRFTGVASSPAAANAKRKTPRRDTAVERKLRRELWARGLRYRIHRTELRGKPDIVFARERLVIFCDGDFWHGKNWHSRQPKLAAGSNGDYWVAKIMSNMKRDNAVTESLRASGWTVLRFWESEVKNNLLSVVKEIVAALKQSPVRGSRGRRGKMRARNGA